MQNIIFLLTKDCMPCESLPIYGNKYWQTPNIDELAANGTVFKRHYTAGGSTSMSMSAMLTGHYLYEFDSRKIYVNVKPSEFPSVFDWFQSNEYECHLIWDVTWINGAWRFVREFGDENKTLIHNLDIAQVTGEHSVDDPLKRDDSLLEKTYSQIYETLSSININKKQFIWLHLPHILKGRRSYMDDMDAFDNIVGFVRRRFGDDSIFLSSDHGHMNLHKGQIGYGFDLYEPIVHIPLITPRIDGLKEVPYLTCNVDLPTLLIEKKAVRRDYVIAETAYYAQPQRKVAIITDRFKYIYNKHGRTEEYYDLTWDPNENHNILKYDYYDKERKQRTIIDEKYFYPYKEEAMDALPQLRKIRNDMWRDAPLWYEWYGIIRKKLAPIKKLLRVSQSNIRG